MLGNLWPKYIDIMGLLIRCVCDRGGRPVSMLPTLHLSDLHKPPFLSEIRGPPVGSKDVPEQFKLRHVSVLEVAAALLQGSQPDD